MSNEDIRNLHDRRGYFAEWLKRNSQAQQIVPTIQANLEFTDWQIEVLSNRPDEAEEIPPPTLSDRIENDNHYILQALPMIPQYDSANVIRASAYTTSGSAGFYDYVARVGDIPTPDAQQYSANYITKYQQIQQAHSRIENIRTLLNRLNDSQLMKRFDRALRALAASKSGATERTAAANEIRNLLHGVQGNLFMRARHWPKENMTWEKMSVRLVKGGSGSPEYDKLLLQKCQFSNLDDRLSDILKDREGGSLTNLDVVWTEVIDRIYVVLGLATA